MATVVDVGVRTSVPSRVGSVRADCDRPHRRWSTTPAATSGVRRGRPSPQVLRGILGLLVAALAVLAPSAASAQDANSLQSIDPADGSSLSVSPTVITLSFNQELADDDALTLGLSCNTEIQDTGLPEVNPDGLVVTVTVNTPLPKTNCLISWALRDGLGETIVQGTSSFGVTADPPATAVDASATGTTSPFIQVPAVPATTGVAAAENDGSSGGVLWLGRMLSTLGILIVFGSLALISIGWPEGPEYVVTVRFLRAVWLVALLGTVLYLIAFAADFGGTSFGSAISPSAWLDLKTPVGRARSAAAARPSWAQPDGWRCDPSGSSTRRARCSPGVSPARR